MIIEEMLLHLEISRVSWVSSYELPSSRFENGSLLEDHFPVIYSLSDPGSFKAIQNSENLETDTSAGVKRK